MTSRKASLYVEDPSRNRVILDYDNKSQDDEFLNSQLPQEPFIVAIGTSHTYGSCKFEQEGTFYNGLKPHVTWSQLLARRTGYNIVRLAMPGTNNTDIFRAIIDVIEIAGDRVQGIIMEARVSDASDFISKELFCDYIENHDRDDWDNRILAKFMGYMNVLHDMHINIDWRYDKNDATNHINNIVGDGVTRANSYTLDTYKTMCDAFGKNLVTGIQYEKELRNIANAASYCKAANIPFMWFYWDNPPVSLTQGAAYEKYTSYYDQVYHINETRCKSLYQSCIEHVSTEHGSDYLHNEVLCTCGHMDNKGHAIVAKIIEKDFKDKHFIPREINQ